jgi:DNA-binding response OmpR family regulator
MAEIINVLLADDDEELCELLVRYLSDEGLQVTAVHSGDRVIPTLQQQTFAMLILDIMMPGQNGLDVLRELRVDSMLPVLMLTAHGDEVDRIVGLELGADDYLPKPCNPRELLARIRAVLRRGTELPSANGEQRLGLGGLTLDVPARKALLEQKPLSLTSVEFDLLKSLLGNAGRPVSRDELSEQALGRALLAYDRSVDVHISNLRRKLATAAQLPPRIVAIRHRGYQLVDA